MDMGWSARHSYRMEADAYITSLRRAEAELLAGRLDSARIYVEESRQAAGNHPDVLHVLALVERKSGNLAAAEKAFAAAIRLAPKNPKLLMNFANFLQAMGKREDALELYDRAMIVAPTAVDIRFNRVLVLTALGRIDEALADTDALLSSLPLEPRLHSIRAVILRAFGRLRDAGEAFDRALELDPEHQLALHGRAQIARDRDEEGTVECYRRALRSYPADTDLILGLAEALEAEGLADQAIATLEEVVAANGSWINGHAALARTRWEVSKGPEFVRDLESALKADPGNGPLWSILATTLAGADLPAAAAQAAAEGVHATEGDIRLKLLEAFLVSEAGETARADQLFAALPPDVPGREFSEARHALRAHRFDQAAALLDKARAESPWDIAVWAMTGLVWRLTNDPRSEWLNFQRGLVRQLNLGLNSEEIEKLAQRLRTLHRTRVRPLHQSLRGGTQSRGRLFEREEPEIASFAQKVREVVERYWRELPPTDSSHPLLRHREQRPIIEGSWSVRLTDGGFHIPHFHPEGVVSSAAYIVVPEGCRTGEGWLEIGGAPADHNLTLEPIATIRPQPGKLALFPSYMFHSTRPFGTGERLTIAFDVVTA